MVGRTLAIRKSTRKAIKSHELIVKTLFEYIFICSIRNIGEKYAKFEFKKNREMVLKCSNF